MPPQTIAESARLKTAKWVGAMKSTTAPLEDAGRAEDPVGEVAEGAAEQQPERDRPGQAVELAGSRAITTITAAAITVKTMVMASPKPKAAPAVADRLELQPVADHLDRRVVLQPGDHEQLADQVE